MKFNLRKALLSLSLFEIILILVTYYLGELNDLYGSLFCLFVSISCILYSLEEE